MATSQNIRNLESVEISLPDTIFKDYRNNPITPYLNEAVMNADLDKFSRYSVALGNTLRGLPPSFLKPGEIFTGRHKLPEHSDAYRNETVSPYLLEDVLTLYVASRIAAKHNRNWLLVEYLDKNIENLSAKLKEAGIFESV